jgi:hypothetical protein
MSTDSLRGDIEIRYQLLDVEGDAADISAEFSVDDGAIWVAASDAGGASEGFLNLSAPTGGALHTFVWDGAADLPDSTNWNKEVLFRIVPKDSATGEIGGSWTSLPFTVNINNVPLVTGITPVGPFPNSVLVQYILLDAESDAADVTVEYAMAATGPWSAATRKTGEGEGIAGLTTTPSGVVHEFVWDCGTDLSSQANVSGVLIRITPVDAAAPSFSGIPWVSGSFSDVNYNSAPSVLGSTLSTVFSPSTTLAISYTLTDTEGNPADITVEYQKSGTGPWILAVEEDSGGEGITDLATSPAPGTAHVFIWDFSSETVADLTVAVRISVADATFGNGIFPVPPTPWVSNSFQINATAGAHTSIVTVLDISEPQCDTVVVTYTLIDDFGGTGHPVNVEVKYSTDGGTSWLPSSGSAGEASWDSRTEGTTSLSADPDGEEHVFVWDSFADLGGTDHPTPGGSGVMIRVISTEYGNYHGTSAFPLLNTRVATLCGTSGAVLNGPSALVFDSAGNIYICDTYNNRIQVLNAQATEQVFAGLAVAPYSLGVIAGKGMSGYNGDNIPARDAFLNFPRGIALDNASPPNIYVADTLNHRIRRIDAGTGYITTMAGTGSPGQAGDGNIATQVQLNAPQDLAFDGAQNLWIADTGNNQIRFFNRGSTPNNVFGTNVQPGRINLIAGKADGSAGYGGDGKNFDDACKFRGPRGLVVDTSDNIYLCDSGNHRLRVANGTIGAITIAGTTINAGDVKTVAGTGDDGFSNDGSAPTTAELSAPCKIVLDASGNIFFSDTGNHRIRAIDVGTGTLVVGAVSFAADTIQTVAGGGAGTGDAIPALNALLMSPEGLTLDGLSPQNLYLTDTGANRVRVVNSLPSINLNGVATDQGSAITVAGSAIETVAGSPSTGIQLIEPVDTVLHATDLYIADPAQNRVFKLDLLTRALTVVAGTGQAGYTGDSALAVSAQLNGPRALGLDSTGDLLLIADSGNSAIRVVNLGTASVSAYGQTVGVGNIETISTNAKMCQGIWIDRLNHAGAGIDEMYATCGAALLVVQIARTGGNQTTIAGNGAIYSAPAEGGPPLAFGITLPHGICIDSAGTFYVSDAGEHRVYSFTVAGTMSTVAGTGKPSFNGDNLVATSTDLHTPSGLLLDGAGNLLLFEAGNHIVRRLVSGNLSILCGTTTAGYNGAGKPPINTQLNRPKAGVLSGAGDLFFCDTGNRMLRRFHP